MSVLDEFIDNNIKDTPNIKMLPLVHSCDAFKAIKIIKSNELKATHCKVFDENLLYFFYGKPSYLVSNRITTNTNTELYYPVCFLIDPNKIKPSAIYPFDSGAFMSSDKYKTYIHPEISIDTYKISKNYEGILKYVYLIYETNECYISGEAKTSSFKAEHPEITGLLNFINVSASENFDERAHTIEVISDENYTLTEVVKFIILPNCLLKYKEINEWLKATGIRYKTYKTTRLNAPNFYNGHISQILNEYLEKEGYVDE